MTTPATRRRRTALLAAVLLTVTTSLTGCSLLPTDDAAVNAAGNTTGNAADGATRAERTAHSGPITIGFSPFNLTSPLLRDLGAGLKSYALSKGALVLLADPRNNALTQARQLDSWIEAGRVQAIWAIAVDASILRPVFERAKAKGIAVLATGTPQDYGETDLAPARSYSYIDYRSYGREVGKAIGTCAIQRLGGRARVLHLQNQPGQVGVDEYAAGLREGLTDTSPTSTIVATTDNNSDVAGATEATAKAIRAGAGINAVAAANDAALAGARKAFTDAGRGPAGSCLVGSGGGDDALAAVHRGELFGVVALQYREDLTQNVDQMLQMIADPHAVGMQLLTPITTVTR